jgi:molybdenum cofactor cytidylyltransferase
MKLIGALRSGMESCIAFVGAGGKSSAMLLLAKEYSCPVLLSATTHLSSEQVKLFSSHFVIENRDQLNKILAKSINDKTLFTGVPTEDNRTHGLNVTLLETIYDHAKKYHLPFIIEADGSRKFPLKAPADHEPAIPSWVDQVVVIAGMSSVGKPIDSKHVHRPEIINQITASTPGDLVDINILTKLLKDPRGGLKNIPESADRKLLLNQVSNQDRKTAAIKLAERMVGEYSSVLIGNIPHWDRYLDKSKESNAILERREQIGGIILAAGEAQRFGGPKILLDWGGIPVIRQIALTAIQSGLSPVVLVLGAYTSEVYPFVQDLPLIIIENSEWQNGQSTSFIKGLNVFSGNIGGVVVLLADQPHISVDIIQKIVRTHQIQSDPIIIPTINGQRANPVLFDRLTFPEINKISGDIGGRVLFSQFPVFELPSLDEGLNLDIDTPEDYQRLMDIYMV